MVSFNYAEAFARNIGWVTEAEQLALRSRRVAVAGLGGVGGAHLLTLVRLGIGQFNIADLDQFDLVNFNRQVGASMVTLGRPKIDAMAEAARAINPELDLRLFPNGVTSANLDAFLADVDLFVDGLDFFALDIRRRVFARCAELGIPAITAAPIGFGVGFLAFVPGGMTFEQYFRFDGQPEDEQFLRFLLGVAPSGLHRTYLVDPSRVDLAARRGPSTAMACQLCAGVASTIALKLLLHRGGVQGAPNHLHFDPYRGRLVVSRLRLGNSGPLQRLRLAVARRTLLGMTRPAVPAQQSPLTPIETVLDVARWAPSGDNSQPWRFTVLGPHSADIDFKAAVHNNVYEYRNGEPTVVSAGMLLETLRIAAAQHGHALSWTLGAEHRIHVDMQPASDAVPQPLFPYVAMRSVDRRPYRTRPLRTWESQALETALGPAFSISWHAKPTARLRVARLSAVATAIRLRAAETFGVHQRVIDWVNRDSATGIPSGAVGLDPATLRLMRWALQRWSRVHWLNRLTGTGAVAAQLDYLPGLRSAAFFSIKSVEPVPASGPARVEALLRFGQALQRFWLTATRLGLVMQPNYATLCFAYYGATGASFTADAGLLRRASRLASEFSRVFETSPEDMLFIGRIGEPIRRRAQGRSIRRNLNDLVIKQPAPASTEPATASLLP